MPLNKSGMGWRTEAIEDFAMSEKDTRSSEGIKGFVRVSREALAKLLTCSSPAVKVYLYLTHEANWAGHNAGRASASHRWIAQGVRIPVRNVCRALDELVQVGLITIEQTYPLSLIGLNHWVGDTPVKKRRSSVASGVGSGVTSSSTSSVASGVDLIELSKNLVRTEEELSKKGEQAPPIDPRDIPRPYPDAPSYLLISSNEEDMLIERFGVAQVVSSLEDLRIWLEEGNTKTAIEARSRKGHYNTAIRWIKRDIANGRVPQVSSEASA